MNSLPTQHTHTQQPTQTPVPVVINERGCRGGHVVNAQRANEQRREMEEKEEAKSEEGERRKKRGGEKKRKNQTEEDK